MKKKNKECFCALCRSPRVLRYNRYLSFKNYLQILTLFLVTSAILYPWLGLKVLYSLPVVWGLFEGIHKSLYRKELSCPYCGFDPKWYRKDIKITRQKVEEFLKQNPESPVFRGQRSSENSISRLN